MSGLLRDLNTLAGSERKIESSSKGSFVKPCAENPNNKCLKKNTVLVNSTPFNVGEVANTGTDGGTLEVEYIESENLRNLGDVNTSLSKNWNPRIGFRYVWLSILCDGYPYFTRNRAWDVLVQLLLKSSQDKRFVCEAAERALVAMTIWLSPFLLLPKLQPYLKHKIPRA